jgi:nitric oxide reductase large subunit
VFTILFPLILLGLSTFIIYALSQDFSFGKILLNTIPFVLLVMVALSLLRRKSIFYYLIVVDGLMLLKGICGTIAMVYF